MNCKYLTPLAKRVHPYAFNTIAVYRATIMGFYPPETGGIIATSSLSLKATPSP